MDEKRQELFKELVQVNVGDYIEQKNGLNYLSWANAIQEICLRHNEEFDYEIEKFGESKLPYVYDDGVGYGSDERIIKKYLDELIKEYEQ